ncbi:MAG: ECF transporter S component [Lachnospiraceae bacterium]|nr:ECF transporter S component [Lachnospiraceae bacterium]
MKKNVFDLNSMMQLAMLICIQFVMKAVGLGSVPVGPLYMSFLTLPIAVGAIMIGPEAGAILGGVFGLVSFKDALTGGSLMTSTLLAVNPFLTFVLCVLTRVLMGYLTGIIFRAARNVDRTHTWSFFVGAVAAPLLNTAFFMGFLVLAFYKTDYVQNLVVKYGATNPFMFIALMVGIQALVEAGVCGVLGGAIVKALHSVLGLRPAAAGTAR